VITGFSAQFKWRVFKRSGRWISQRGIFVYDFDRWDNALICALSDGEIIRLSVGDFR
jgi:hypothetical protein